MQLLQAWSESLTLLKPGNFKLFLLVTLKSIVETYKVLLTKFWWAILGAGLYFGLAPIYHFYSIPFFPLPWVVSLFNWCVPLVVFAIFLAARPSVSIKNYHHFKQYIKHFFFFCFLYILIKMFELFFLNGYYLEVPAHFLFLIPPGEATSLTSPLLILFTLFLLDSKGSFKVAGQSIIRSLKMIVYNYPFFLISILGLFACCMLLQDFFLEYGWNYVFQIIWGPLVRSNPYVSLYWTIRSFLLYFGGLLLLPMYICFITNFYVKKKHEQFNLYFPTKGQ